MCGAADIRTARRTLIARSPAASPHGFRAAGLYPP